MRSWDNDSISQIREYSGITYWYWSQLLTPNDPLALSTAGSLRWRHMCVMASPITEHWAVLSWDRVKSRSREIGNLNYHGALRFDRYIGCSATDVPVKFQSDRTFLNTNLAASRLCQILQEDVLLDIETGPWIRITKQKLPKLRFTEPLCWETTADRSPANMEAVVWKLGPYHGVTMWCQVSPLTFWDPLHKG